ncbi:variant 2 [Lathyrus oleraceus]|uniref:starch synthase n=1 Tax=Pisum sativum TaxID=3888 RepID=A0A9D4VLH3_PEA|nr:variant 2 [Pisum sativum]
MASKLTACFVCWNLNSGFNCSNHLDNTRLSRSPFPLSCKMPHRILSSQQRRQYHKRTTSQPSIDGALKPNHRQNSDLNNKLSFNSKTDDSLHNLNSPILLHDTNSTPSALNVNGAEQVEQFSGGQLEDLLTMIKSAETNILLINQARVRALEDLQKILAEKKALQGEINVLEMRLAETEARTEVAGQENTHVELMEGQMEKLRSELAQKGSTEESDAELHGPQNGVLSDAIANSLSHNDRIRSLTEELNSLREENASLKNDIESFKAQLNDVENNDERVVVLEKERLYLESALKDLESKLSKSPEDVSELSTLRVECKYLSSKVENLQTLLDKATKQADQAVIVLQQNQDLQREVDKLETSLEEAKIYKLSSDKLQKYNELMQQKIKMLENSLQKSDEDINSYVQLYQQSVNEFQDTLNILKKESKIKTQDEPVEDMPWEFWSQLLLLIDGWTLEKKITVDDAKLLREKAWKKDKTISDIYMACRGQNEDEAISAFLGLLSSATRITCDSYCSRDGTSG